MISMGSGSISAQLMLFSLDVKKLYQTPPFLLVWDSHIILLSESSAVQFSACPSPFERKGRDTNPFHR